jgi:hypothetical protein
MPLFIYKCFSCMKTFESQRYYDRVTDGGMCPKCHTLITKANLIDARQVPHFDRRRIEEWRIDRDILAARERGRIRMLQMNDEAIISWLRNMRRIDEFMCTHRGSGAPRKQHKPAGDLERTIVILEEQIFAQLRNVLRGNNRQIILRALSNEIVIGTRERVQPNTEPLLVFRFFTGTRQGLFASCQGAIGQGEAQPVWVPEHSRGTVTKSAKMHQRGIKKSSDLSGRRSDVVSTTCCLRNLVNCSAGKYNCTPGGQVVPIIFGMGHIGIPVFVKQYEPMWAPYVALILIQPGSYVCDWTPFLADKWAEGTSQDVSFFEREVTYDTFGGSFHLSNELIIGVWPNPFKGKVSKL